MGMEFYGFIYSPPNSQPQGLIAGPYHTEDKALASELHSHTGSLPAVKSRPRQPGPDGNNEKEETKYKPMACLLLRPALLKACKGANIYLDCNQEQKVRDVTPHPLSIIIQHHHHLHRTSALSHFLLDKQDCTASLIHCIPYPSSYIIVAITTPHP
eukprot:1159445-Pelagomonas_calceolata.AAC.19